MANSLIDIFRIAELRKRILFTLSMLFVFRLGAVIPIPGINPSALEAYFLAQQTASSGVSLTSYLDFFAGGAFSRFSIFMLGIMPYISMSILMQLMLLLVPSLKKISEEEGGRKKIQQYTRYGTVLVCLVQSFVVTIYADSIPNAIAISRAFYIPVSMLTVTTGTMFLMWIGEQINQRGIGNGISLLIFSGIVARIPEALWTLIRSIQQGQLNPVFAIVTFGIFIGVIVLVIYEQRGQRKIPISYSKRVVGRRMYGAQSTYLPFKVNPSGVIPVIFASAVLTFPLQLLQGLSSGARWIQRLSALLRPDGFTYVIFYTLLIVFFAYFYTQVSMNPVEIAKNIRENGGSIPGVRTDNVESHLMKVMNRIILPGALFLSFIAIIPSIIQALFGFPPSLAYLMGGTSLLILVGVDLDLMSQIEAHLRMHHHGGLTKSGRVKGRNL